MNGLYGVVCAYITPMLPDGQVDYAGVRALCAHLVEQGIHCLYPNGTNGESLSLSAEERQRIAEIILEENRGRARLYVQCGAATVAESYAHVRHAKAIGAHGAGLMTPVFFAVDDAAMEEYFENILKETGDFPIYAYNIPSRTGSDLSPAVLGRLMRRHPGLLGIKYSCPDILRVSQYVHCCETRKADVLIGCDMLAQACWTVGGAGWVSGPAAVFPEAHTRLYDQLKAGKTEEARKTQALLQRTMEDIAGIPEIPAIKYMLTKLGVIGCDVCRAPLRALTSSEKQRLDAAMERYAQGLRA